MSGPSVALVAIARDEALYLDEWATYHRLLGCSPIVVYSHESRDASELELERLASHGVLEWHPWATTHGRKPQWDAYADALTRLPGRAEWVVFLDLDEFLVLPRHDHIGAALAERSGEQALALNWRMMGSGGAVERERGLVIERFTRGAPRDFRGNHAVKTLARVDAIIEPRVHTCIFRPGVRYRTVAGEELGPGVGRSERVEHDLIRVNHYFTKSREEWRAKVARGKGAKVEDDPRRSRTDQEFGDNDRNDEQDLDAARRAPEVMGLIRSRRR